MSREAEMSIAVSEMFPGFRFSPTDVELICYYLSRKNAGDESSVAVIAEVDIYKFEPWDLPDHSILKSENEWFFFCTRGKKYPHGSQSRRATELGYWKATGKERNVKSGSQVVGTKRTLVFHIGRAPRGERTEWIMHEYCMTGAPEDALVLCRLRRNGNFRTSPSQGQMQDGECHGDCNTSNDDAHRTDASGGDNKTTGSYSTSESERKQSNDTIGDSSNDVEDPSKDDVDCEEDDCYAEILNDDIIKLEETSPTARPLGEPSSKLCKVKQALQSNPTLQKLIYTDISHDNKSEYVVKKGSNVESRCFLCFGIKNIENRKFQDMIQMKNVDRWVFKDVFGVALLALLISVLFVVFAK